MGAEPRQWDAGGRRGVQERGRGRLPGEDDHHTRAAGASSGESSGMGVGGREGLDKARARSRSHSMHMVDVAGEYGIESLVLEYGMIFVCMV